MIKALLLIWLASGGGLLGYGMLEAARSYYIISSTEALTIEGTVAGKHSRFTEIRKSLHTTSFVWFPQIVVEWADPSGESHQSTDPNIVPFFRYEAGQKVSLKVYPHQTNPALSQVFVSDYYTRFAFPVALMILGAVFIALPIVGWNSLDAACASIANTLDSTPSGSPFELKYFLWGFFALAGFAAFMTLRPYLKGLLPDDCDRKYEPPPPVAEKEGAAPLPSPPVAKIAGKQAPSAGRDNGPERILDARTHETSLMRELKRGDPDVVRAMMERKFDPNARDVYGRNILYYAVSGQQTDAVRKLIGLGADIEGSSVDVLIEAIEVRNSATAHLLLDAGKAVNTLDKRYNMYPFDMAVYHELPDVAVRLAKQDIRHTAPDEFVEVARNPGKYSGAVAPKKSFHGMSLQRWTDMVRQ